MQRPDYARMLRFGTVGAINTVLGYTVILVALVAGWSDLAANSMGYAVGIGIGFILNRNWTFQNGFSFQHGTLVRYILVFAICYGLNLTVMFATKALGAPSVLAHLAAVATYSIYFYLGSARYVFAQFDVSFSEHSS